MLSLNPTPTHSVQNVFQALADPTRRQLLQRLADGPATITQLANGLPISRQAVTKHLGTLSAAALVRSQPSGRERRYTLTPTPMNEAMEWMQIVGARWDARLAALKDYLANNPEDDEG